MNVLETMEKWRTIRRFRPDPVPEEVLGRLLNALRLAPSGGNLQPWKFIVVRDPTTKERVAEACAYVTVAGEARPQMWIATAPVVVVACGKEELAAAKYLKGNVPTIAFGLEEERPEHESILYYDLTIAMDRLSLAAIDEGLGSCWIGALHEKRVKEILSIPDDWRAPLAMPIGYPAQWPTGPRQRKPLEEIICYHTFAVTGAMPSPVS